MTVGNCYINWMEMMLNMLTQKMKASLIAGATLGVVCITGASIRPVKKIINASLCFYETLALRVVDLYIILMLYRLVAAVKIIVIIFLLCKIFI